MLMNYPTQMLYKFPGKHDIHGDKFDYIVVKYNNEEIEKAISEGWALTTDEAKNSVNKKEELQIEHETFSDEEDNDSSDGVSDGDTVKESMKRGRKKKNK